MAAAQVYLLLKRLASSVHIRLIAAALALVSLFAITPTVESQPAQDGGACVICCNLMIHVPGTGPSSGCSHGIDCDELFRNSQGAARISLCQQVGFPNTSCPVAAQYCENTPASCGVNTSINFPRMIHRATLMCDCDGDGTSEKVGEAQACRPYRDIPGFQSNVTVTCNDWYQGPQPSMDGILRDKVSALMQDLTKTCKPAKCSKDYGKCERDRQKQLDDCGLSRGSIPGRSSRRPAACWTQWRNAGERCTEARDSCLGG